MRPLAFAAAIFLLAGFLSAQPENLSVRVTTVNNLVAVNSSIDFASLLPGYEHNGTITVYWAIPNESIASVKAESVTVYILMTTDQDNSIYFRQGGANSKEARLKLECIVQNGSCAAGSNLSASVEALALAVGKQDSSNTISINSSLSPLWQEAPLGLPPSAVDVLSNTSAKISEIASGVNATGSTLLNPPANSSSPAAPKRAAGETDFAALLMQNAVPIAALVAIVLVIAAAYILKKRKYN